MGYERTGVMDRDRDFDIMRIIGQLESSINSVISADNECRKRQMIEHDKIYRLLGDLKDDLMAQRDFIYIKVEKESKALRSIIDLKYDIELANKLIKEIDNIKDILGLDNAGKVKKNWGIMNNLISYVLLFSGFMGVIITIIITIKRVI